MRQPSVAVIGAGMSGICAAAKLQFAGIEDVVVYEKAERVGGTWRENTYPGLSCDVPSRYYCYTFAPNPDWTHLFSPGAEIYDYLDRVVDDLGLRPRIRCATEVADATWTEEGRWRVRTASGEERAFDFLISAAGVLHHPRTPDIPGAERFRGARFHSARWDHTVPLDGRRVAIVGTGSTGVQITKALAPRCPGLKLFQRTPQWVFPIGNPAYRPSTRRLLRRVPALNRVWGRAAYRFYQRVFESGFCQAVIKPGWQRRLISALCRLHLRGVSDPVLRARLTPGDQPMCKRMIIAAGFYTAFERDGAQLVDTPIERINERGIVTADGVQHELDVIVFATGFDAHAYLQPVELHGPGGVTLSEVWSGEPRGYRTVALPSFPNFFLLLGPHSPIGNQSLFMITETQIDYVLQWVRSWQRGEYAAASPKAEAADAFNAEMRTAYPETIWTSGCQSWYLGKDGLPALWPWSPGAHREMLAAPRVAEWELEPVSSQAAGAAA
jgi:cation diffusion facilitator CzcD-associated flavoprotein CzcO